MRTSKLAQCLLVAGIVLAALLPNNAAGNVFLGIGNGGYVTDVYGLWDAMNDWPQWQTADSMIIDDSTPGELLGGLARLALRDFVNR